MGTGSLFKGKTESWVEVTSMGDVDSTKIVLVIREEDGTSHRFPIPNVVAVNFEAQRGPGLDKRFGCVVHLKHVHASLHVPLKIEGMSAGDLLAEIAASKLEQEK